jgi:hypothetical protein
MKHVTGSPRSIVGDWWLLPIPTFREPLSKIAQASNNRLQANFLLGIKFISCYETVALS